MATFAFSGRTRTGQTITGLTFTVSGLVDGANETIVVDGKTITLGATGSGTTTTNGLSYTATVSGGTATVVLSGGTLNATATQALVNGITYQNTNVDQPTAGNRVFTLTQVKDSGGVANSGVDTTTLSVASTVGVTALNDAPTLSATASNPTFTEGAAAAQGAAVTVFDNSPQQLAQDWAVAERDELAARLRGLDGDGHLLAVDIRKDLAVARLRAARGDFVHRLIDAAESLIGKLVQFQRLTGQSGGGFFGGCFTFFCECRCSGLFFCFCVCGCLCCGGI